MARRNGWWTMAVLAACMPALAVAADARDPLPQDPTRDPMLMAAGFLRQHPDLIYRKYGMEALARKDYADAMRHFRKAGLYADKVSQAMVAEMLWLGTGVAMDRPAAYAWMDLAAEREYRIFVLQREKYWLDMSKAERTRALEIGQALYAEYGDEQAKPRLALALRWEQKKAVGSRLGGFAGASVRITTPSDDGDGDSIDGSKFYDPQFWDPEKYWAYTDRLWHNIGKQGHVTVGEVQKASDAQIKHIEASGDRKPDAEAESKPD